MFYSAYSQDIFVNGLLDGKENGTFVDIGACEGMYVSNTYFFEKHKHWTGLCIEANKDIFGELCINRPGSTCINTLIYDDKGDHKFICENIPQFSGIKEMKESHGKYDTDGISSTVVMKGVLLNNVLKENKLFNIDFMSIDAEGCEIKILNSIDFDTYNIEVICFEINEELTSEFLEFIRNKGYEIIARLGGDLILTKYRKARSKYFQEVQYFNFERLYQL